MKTLIKLCIATSLAYITLGDLVLPNAYGNKSQEVREDINQYLISLFPNNKLETLRRSELMVENLERGDLSSPSNNL